MTIQAQTPDGLIHEFPDGTPDSVVDGAIKSYLGTQQPSFAQSIGNDISNRYNNLKSDIGNAQAGNMNPVASGIAGTGEIFGAANDIAGEAIKRIPGISDAASTLSDIAHGGAQLVADAIDSPATEDIASNVGSGAQEFSQNHPDYMAAVKGGANILGGLGLVEGAANAGKSLLDASASNAAKISSEQAPSFLPKGPRSYDAVKSANDALADNTSAAYNKADEIGMNFSPDNAQNLVNQIRSDVGTLVPKASPQTASLLDALESDSSNGLTLPQLEEYRKQLGRISWNTTNPNDAPKAFAAKQSIDSYLSDIKNNPDLVSGANTDSIDAIEQGRAAHSLEQQHSQLMEMQRQANGNPNVLQSKLKTLFDNKDEFFQFSPEDRSIISTIAHPTGVKNLLEVVGKAGFGAGDKALPAWGELGAAAFSGNPLVAGAAITGVTAGTAANVARGVIVRNAFDKLLSNIESRSVPFDSTLGTRGFSPLPDRTKLLPAPSDFTTNKVGTTSPPANASYTQPRGATELSTTGNSYPSGKSAQQELEDIAGQQYGDFMSRNGYKKGGQVKEPSEAQKHAGNYKKEHISLYGLNIAIENPKGSFRSGTDKDGKRWRVKMPVDYGYIKGYMGADGDHIDCFVGPRLKSENVYIIDQKDPHTGKFDEHKIMLGFPAQGYALAAYRKSFSDAADGRIHAISKLSIQELKQWLDKIKKKESA